MMDISFKTYFESFIEAWKAFSLSNLEQCISKEYKAREITSTGEMIDFGYEESINGWAQAFEYFSGKDAKWVIEEVQTIILRDDEVMVIMWATLIVEGKQMETANLFFDTFKKDDSKNEWKLVRSYIEAGVPINNMKDLIVAR